MTGPPDGSPAPPARRRDRHGRGLRGRLVPPAVRVAGRDRRVPLSQTRSERFDDLVRDAVQELDERWATELADVELAVEEVPPDGAGSRDGVIADDTTGGPVALGLLVRPPDGPPRITVYRRPLEARALDRAELAELVAEVVQEQVADLLGLDPRDLP
ncbi:MAG: metallopeptidase family protein [Pseudorhodobacter sp.]|nr:metallopeptidase family protein [Frankiaceae bacterium]